MTPFVLDCSFTMTWCFEDEKSPVGDEVLDKLVDEEMKGIVPSLWRCEVINILSIAEKHERISVARGLLFLDFLLELPIIVDETPPGLKDLLLLSREYNLSAYDATYLDLALREQIPLATLDKKLANAAKCAQVPLLLQ